MVVVTWKIKLTRADWCSLDTMSINDLVEAPASARPRSGSAKRRTILAGNQQQHF